MTPRPYQQEAIDTCLNYLKNNLGNPLIVAPTGSGKALILCCLTKELSKDNKSVLILSHRKEILSQNYNTLLKIYPFAPVDIYSASLGQKRLNRITIAQIQSLSRKKDLPKFDYIIIDECHLVPSQGEGQYQTLLKQMPNSKVIGLTATPERLDSGAICGGGNILTECCYRISIIRLIKEKFLCPVKGKGGIEQADLDGVRKRMGEFVLSEAAERMNNDRVTLSAIKEMIEIGKSQNRKSWLIFSSGVEHAQKILNGMRAFNVLSEIITGETLPMHREKIISDFQKNKITCLINAEVLTTGFDAPNVDLIGLLRATASRSLYTQILGRGMRISEGKKDCLVLDFGRNLERHGTLDYIDEQYEKMSQKKQGEKKEKESGDSPAKLCPECRMICHAAARECLECGFIFPEPKPNLETKAAEGEFISSFQIIKPSEYEVLESKYELMTSKKSGLEMLVGMHRVAINFWIREYVCFNHPKGSFPLKKAHTWWKERAIKSPIPPDSKTAYDYISFLYELKTIWVKREGKYDRIVSAIVDKEKMFNPDEVSIF